MLLEQRRKRQKLTGKIGHSEEEYQVSDNRHAVAVQHNAHAARRFLWRKSDVNPISWQEKNYYEQQPQGRQTPSTRQQPQEYFPFLVKNVFSGASQVDLAPWQKNPVNSNNRGLSPTSVGLPAVISPIHAAPVFFPSAVGNKTPMRFPSVFETAPVISTQQVTPCVKAVVPLVGQFTPPSPRLGPQPQVQSFLPPTHLVSSMQAPTHTPTKMGLFGNENDITTHGSNTRLSQQPRHVAGSMGFFPEKDDTAQARARQQALELQMENARLSEERRLRLQREKQQEAEEERRMERLALEQEKKLEQKKLEKRDIERDVPELGKVSKTKGHVSDIGGVKERQEDDLQKQIEEKKLWHAEEAWKRLEKEKKAIEEFAQKLKEQPVDCGANADFLSSEKKKETEFLPSLQDFSLFVKNDVLSGGISNPLTPPCSNEALPFALNTPLNKISPQGAGVPGSFCTLPPLHSFDMAAPLPPVAFAERESATAFPTPSVGLPPASLAFMQSAATPPASEPLTAENKRHEFQLRDMIAKHTDLQRMLQMEVRKHTKKLDDTEAKSMERPASVFESHQTTFLSPVNNVELPSLSPARSSTGQSEQKHPDNTLFSASPQEPASFLTRGILKPTLTRLSHISEVGTNTAQFLQDATAAPSLFVPQPSKFDPDELSAEPSQFIGPKP